MYGTTKMVESSYKHLVEYDPEMDKIIIHRVLESGQIHLYTEIPISKINKQQRTLEGVGRVLGETLILDMNKFRDKVI
jgi:hypothetical protein